MATARLLPGLERFDPRAWASPRVCGRGLRYYREGRVGQPTARPDGVIEAFVLGTLAEPYRVEVSLIGDEPYATCTCPFDAEPLCKHAVALLFAVCPETAGAAEQEEPREEPREEPARRRRGRKRVVVDRAERLRLARDLETADRMARAKEQGLRIVRRPPGGAYGEYLVASAAGDGTYRVVVRDRTVEESSCSCPDFLHNELQTCKHVERVKRSLERSQPGHGPASVWVYARPRDWGDGRPDPSAEMRVVVSPRVRSQPILDVVARSLDASGHVRPERLEGDLAALQAACKTARVRLEVDPEVARRLGALRAAREWRRKTEKLNPDSPEVKRALDRLRVSLHPYQKEGVLFAVRGRRVLLGDEMGLGKTLQAIGAALVLREMGEVERVLVLCPASLKRQWQSEVERRAGEPARIIEGLRPEREAIYAEAAPLFTIANYELVYRDLEALRALKPELIVLDEAQRIKNWDTKTARAVSRLESRFAIVLTGTPLENRLEELHSLFRVVDSRALGPLWRIGQAHVELDAEGRRKGYVGLRSIRERIAHAFLRRDRRSVLKELPEVTENFFFTPLTDAQRLASRPFEERAARLLAMAERRPLTPDEIQILFQLLTSARIIANALAQFEWDAVEPLVRSRRSIDPMVLARLESPKLEEWRRVAEELLESDGKVVVFSQWERMLHLAELSVRDLLEQRGFEALFFAGSVPVKVRAGTVERFHSDPRVRLLFSTDAGGVGLNLQEASSTVVHLDMPWNPAVLAQRVGRVHRMGQRRGVRVLHFISAQSIEERVFETARAKRALFDGLLGDGDGIVLDDASRRTFVERVRCLIAPPAAAAMAPAAIPAELPEAKATRAAQAQITPEHSESSAPPAAVPSAAEDAGFVMSVEPATGAVTIRAGNAAALLAALQALSAQPPSPAREAAPPVPEAPSPGPPAHRALPLHGDPSRLRLEASARLAQLDPLAERGHERLAEGDLAAAVRIFETVLSRSEEHLESWLGLADATHASRDLERAVKAYRRALAIGRAALPTGFAGRLPWEAFGNRPFLRALAGLAATLAETGEGRAAEEARRELLALAPDAPLDTLMPPAGSRYRRRLPAPVPETRRRSQDRE